MTSSFADGLARVGVTGWPAALVAAAIAGYGVHLVTTALGWRWTGLQPGPAGRRGLRRHRNQRGRRGRRSWVSTQHLSRVAAAVLTTAVTLSVFGSPLVALVVGVATPPVMATAARAGARHRSARMREVWPGLLEIVRLEVVGSGRSLPAALLAAGDRAQEPLRGAFEAARREWVMTGDFAAMLAVLTQQLQDPVADVVAETLLVAHEMGGAALDRRLRVLAEDRRRDAQERKDAIARQAGVRFARWFVVVVPAGMALVGLSIGDGRSAYASAGGQAAVLAALAMIAGCWWWAASLLRLPTEPRVFTRTEAHQ